MDFRVDLDIFRGPLDLLLYLVRKHEVEIVDIPIAPITDQFLDYLALLEQLDVNAVGDFLEMASTLVEIKSRMVLPRGGEVEDELARSAASTGPAAAGIQEIQGRGQHARRARPQLAGTVSPLGQRPAAPRSRSGRRGDPGSRAVGPGQCVRPHRARERSHAALEHRLRRHPDPRLHGANQGAAWSRRGRLAFRELFRPGMHKSALVGIFLAILELVRHHQAQAEQNELFGELWILPGPDQHAPLDLSQVDEYDHGVG